VRPLEEDEIETIIEYGNSEDAHQAISFTDTTSAAKEPLFPPKEKKVEPEEEPEAPAPEKPAPRTRTRPVATPKVEVPIPEVKAPSGFKPVVDEPHDNPAEVEPKPDAVARVIKRRVVRAPAATPKAEAEVIQEPVKRAVPAKPVPTTLDSILSDWGDA
jgi:hypothetical protein